MTVYLVNRSPHISLEGKVTEEVWTRVDIDLSNLKILRCLAYVLIFNDKRSKLNSKPKKFFFLGLRKASKDSDYEILRLRREYSVEMWCLMSSTCFNKQGSNNCM